MGNIKTCLTLLLVAKLSGTALAQTPPPYSPGANQLKSRGEFVGTTYEIDLDAFDAAGLWGVALDPDHLPASVTKSKPRGAFPQPENPGELEDEWGLVHTYFIKPGILMAGAHAVSGFPGATAWDNSDGLEDTWLVSMFWGGNYTALTFNSSPSTVSATLETENIHMELWAVSKATLAASAIANGVGPIDPEYLVDFDPANRSAANRYDGWLDGVGIKLLSGVSVEFFTNITVNFENMAFDGQSHVYFDIDENDAVGLWNKDWGDQDVLRSLVYDRPADAYFNWDLENSIQGWDLHGTDLGGVYVNPVDAADYVALKQNFGLGSGATQAQGDFNGDGAVDYADLQILMNYFMGDSGGAAITPEPTTLGLLAVGGLAMIRRRRRMV